MNNCLVTKLKGVVNDNNLNYLGGIILYAPISDGSYKSPIRDSSNTERILVTILDDAVTITDVKGDAVIVDSKHGYCTKYGDALILSGATNNYVRVLVAPKYNITYINCGLDSLPEAQEANAISSISYLDSIANLQIQRNRMQGDISSLKTCPNIATLNMSWNSLLYGNIVEALGTLTSLGTLGIASLKKIFTGSFDELVKAQVSNGRTIGSISIPQMNYVKVPFGSISSVKLSIPDSGANSGAVLSWTGNKMVLASSTEYAGSKIYTIGYSDEEIAEKTNPGGDWEGHQVIKADLE